MTSYLFSRRRKATNESCTSTTSSPVKLFPSLPASNKHANKLREDELPALPVLHGNGNHSHSRAPAPAPAMYIREGSSNTIGELGQLSRSDTYTHVAPSGFGKNSRTLQPVRSGGGSDKSRLSRRMSTGSIPTPNQLAPNPLIEELQVRACEWCKPEKD